VSAVVAVTVSGPGSPRSYVQDPDPALVRTYALRTVAVNLDAAMDEATAADERHPVFSLRADWTGTGNYDHRWSNLTRMVEEFSLTEELATDLPAQVGYVEGTSSRKLQLTLGGQMTTDGYINNDDTYLEEVDTVYAFSPYGPSGPGPLINVAMELRTGFQTSQGPATMVQFTGKLSGYSPSASSRDVVVDALDPVAQLRRPITIYAYGVDGILLARYGNAAYPFAINCQWYIDAILRANGYHASPSWGGIYGEAGCVLSATMHGSYQHEIGSVTYVTSIYYTIHGPNWISPFEYGATALPTDPGAHPFQMMYPKLGYDITVKWLCRSAGPMRPGIDGWGMSGWVQLPAAGSSITGDLWSFQPVDRASTAQMVMQLKIINGQPYVFMLWPGGQQALYTVAGFTLPSQSQWMFIGCHFNSEPGGVRISMNFGGQYAVAFVAVPVPVLSYEPAALAFGRTILPFTNFSIWYQPGTPGALDWVGQTWTPTAYVDPAVNWIGGAPDIINRESYDLLKEIVAADFGTFYFDETGMPYFRSRIVNRGWNRAPETLTSQRALSDLVVAVDDSAVRNSIDYEFSLWAAQQWEVIWEPDDLNYLSLADGALGTWYIPLPEDCPIIAETNSDVVQWVSSENWDNVDNNPYYADKVVFAASALSNTTVDAYTGIQNNVLHPRNGGYFTFRIRRFDPRTAILQIYNNIGFGVRFATVDKVGTDSSTGLADNSQVTVGKPAFRITGRKITETPAGSSSVRDEASIARYGLQTYDLGGRNQWRQTQGSGDLLSASVMQWTSRPKPILQQVEVPHNPRRRLYDKIILTEPDSFGARIWCTLAARTVTYNNDGARDQLTLRPDSAPPGW
jgi:hypothetical protein